MQEIANHEQSLSSLERLKRLYASGYRSEVMDRSVAKLLDVERFAIERQLMELQQRLTAYEAKYGMSSADFYARFKAGQLGDAMD